MIVEGFLLGFLGSLHCLAMCGGLAMASRRRGWQGLAVYQVSRLLGYLLLGAASGAFGSVSRHWLGGAAVQATVGILLIAYGFGWLPQAPGGALGRVLAFFGPILRRPTWGATALMGAITALLPCGLLGAAYLKAGATLTAGAGAIFMGAFWLGTAPALLASSSLAGWANGEERRATRVRRLLAATMIVMGSFTLAQALRPLPPGPDTPQKAKCGLCRPETP